MILEESLEFSVSIRILLDVKTKIFLSQKSENPKFNFVKKKVWNPTSSMGEGSIYLE